jgi:geranylgeranyl reductase family protein
MTDRVLEESYDLLIVGAGPAGSSAARAAARGGIKVLLIDKRRQIGVPVQCAEFVPQSISRYLSFSSNCIHQTIDTMVSFLPDGKCVEMKSPGYILDRSLFDKELASAAILSGASLSIQTRAIGRLFEGVRVERGGEERVVPAKIIIGADGVHSRVAGWMGHAPPRKIVALQYEVVNPHPKKQAHVFFDRNYEGGYGWFFPKGTRANVGVGVVPQKGPLLLRLLNELLNKLVHLNGMGKMHILRKTGGSIPCDVPRTSVSGNLLLVGDAACHAHPISGAGILNAVVGGEIAGKVASEAIHRGDLDHLKNYEIEWRETFGESLSYGSSKRKFLEENWNRPGVDFEGFIRKTWVGVKEYYEDRRKG